jgi:hypothetical protein
MVGGYTDGKKRSTFNSDKYQGHLERRIRKRTRRLATPANTKKELKELERKMLTSAIEDWWVNYPLKYPR